MNLVLLHDSDFVEERRVRLTDRRAQHILTVHRASVGKSLAVGRINGRIGTATVTHSSAEAVELDVELTQDPPAPLPMTLVVALPRPKVVNRLLAAATSMGVKRFYLINAWKVEKSYWKSPRLEEPNIRLQCELGLEQGRDTVMPIVETRRFFRRFVEDELPALSAGTTRLVAHPGSQLDAPRSVGSAVTLAIGPEGGFIDEEVASLERADFTRVAIGERILRVETAIAALLGRLF